MNWRFFTVVAFAAAADQTHDLPKLFGSQSASVIGACKGVEVGAIRGKVDGVGVRVEGIADQLFEGACRRAVNSRTYVRDDRRSDIYLKPLDCHRSILAGSVPLELHRYCARDDPR